MAAIRVSQLGMRVACVEEERPGGVCLNWGCIPTKVLLRNAEVVTLLHHAKEFGISFDNLRVDYAAAIRRSGQVAERLSKTKRGQSPFFTSPISLLDKNDSDPFVAGGYH